MEIKIGIPDEDGLQKYRMFFEITENSKTKKIIVKYDEWMQSKSGRVFDLNTYQFIIENIETIYYQTTEIKSEELFNEDGFLEKPAEFYTGTEIKSEGSNAYDEYCKISTKEEQIELINGVLQNI